MGSLVSVDHKDRVASHVADAVEKGATVLAGGRERPDLGPAFYEPTILEDVTKDMLTGSCETFGPVVALHRYASVDEAVELANDTDYGLNASVWGSDLKAADRGRRSASRPATSTSTTSLAAAYASKGTPSGGVKQSGVGARHGDQGLLKYTDAHQPRRAQEAGPLRAARQALRGARRADPQGAGVDAEAGHPLARFRIHLLSGETVRLCRRFACLTQSDFAR